MNSGFGFRVPRPRIERTIRSQPGQVTVGDTSIATTTTALIDLVEILQESDVNDARGFALRYSLPFQLGATAADAILAPTRVESLLWAAYQVDVQWFSCPSRNGFLQARARLELSTPSIARFSITADSAELLCAKGSIHYVCIHDGINRATNRPVATPKTLRPPVAEKQTTVDQHYSNAILQLLMNPIAGGREPLGRRLHPLGSLPLGAAVYQAKRLAGNRRPVSASMKYHATLNASTGFATRARLIGDKVRVSITSETGIEAATATILFPGFEETT